MTCPPYSRDLNVIENVWGWLTRKVYEGGKQYEDKETLTAAFKRICTKKHILNNFFRIGL